MPYSSAQQVLQDVFGYPDFRGLQREIIETVLAGDDALVLMPTGGGKSLCYQIPAILRNGVAIVVSPLIALMQDQVDALLQLGVRAAFLNSSLDAATSRDVTAQLIGGELDLLYVAPERLLMEGFLAFLEKVHKDVNIALFAIDEAHCVSQWGHDFRPEYRALSILHERFPDVPRIALTATADVPTRNEIIERLALEQARQFVSSFDRSNIRYRIVLKSNARAQLLAFLESEHRNNCGIVYCLSRKKVEETAGWLQSQGWNAIPYHAGLPPAARSANQQRFLREEGVIVVATVAFGMGIDKPNVRFVAHLDLPKSMEGYYQETGRAGRDGLSSDAWMAYGLGDVVSLRQMIDGGDASDERKRVERRKLDALLGFCEATQCRRQTILRYFGEEHSDHCGNCDNCLEPQDTWDGTKAVQMALSCVFRTGQRFGVGHLTDVLLGNQTPQILRHQHHVLSVFGIGDELSPAQWSSVFRQMIAAGLLEADESYGGLRLTEATRPVLRGEQTVLLRRDPAPLRSRSSKTRHASTTATVSVAEGDPLLLALKSKRMDLARAQGVPPYVIFHDSTLLAMCDQRPHTLEDMAQISGIGQRKLEKYGEVFLQVLADHRF